jgi:DNA-3-methyladenine glycosylase II
MPTPRSFSRLLRTAERHPVAVHPGFPPIIERVGRCTLTPNPDVFQILVHSLISQFISTAAAKAISARLEARLKGNLTPARLLALGDDDLKACGISGGKARSVRSVAEHFRSNRNYARDLAAADDDTARTMLLPLHGVGPWTVDMILMFSHGRPDILPVGDLGLRAAARDFFGLKDLPAPKQLTALAEPWRPFRTVATWYLWRSRGWSGKWE